MRTADNAVSGGGGVSASVSLHVSFSAGALVVRPIARGREKEREAGWSDVDLATGEGGRRISAAGSV